jgi:hypothetical protein
MVLQTKQTSPRPNGTNAQLLFPSFDRRKIEASFDGGNVSSAGGLLLLRQLEERLGWIKYFSRVLPDDWHPSLISHSYEELLRQRIFGLVQSCQDLNDHDTLRHALLWRRAVHRDTPLASSSTLCRLQKRADRQRAVAMHAVLVEKFIASFRETPKRLILDFDATHDRGHGHQEGRLFHGYYGDDCLLPLYVFCNEQLLVSTLRPSNIAGARHAWAILKLLVTRLRE